MLSMNNIILIKDYNELIENNYFLHLNEPENNTIVFQEDSTMNIVKIKKYIDENIYFIQHYVLQKSYKFLYDKYSKSNKEILILISDMPVFFDGVNILKLENYYLMEEYKEESNSLFVFNDKFSIIRNNIININDNYDLIVNTSQTIYFKSYYWYKNHRLTIINNKTHKQLIIEVKEEELTRYLNLFKNKDFENIKLFFTNLYNLQTDDKLKEKFIENFNKQLLDKFDTQNVPIGKKRRELIFNNINKFFIPITIEDNVKVFIRDFLIDKYDEEGENIFRYIKNGKEIENVDKYFNIRKNISIFKYENSLHDIDIYSGNVTNYKYEEKYRDNNGLIIDSNYIMSPARYYIKHDNVWVDANNDETQEIIKRKDIILKLQ